MDWPRRPEDKRLYQKNHIMTMKVALVRHHTKTQCYTIILPTNPTKATFYLHFVKCSLIYPLLQYTIVTWPMGCHLYLYTRLLR